MLTHGIPSDFPSGVNLFIPPYAIGSVPSLSGHAIAYRWRSRSKVRRHRASNPQGSSSKGYYLCRSPWINSCAPLFSRTHYWYEVGILNIYMYVWSSDVACWTSTRMVARWQQLNREKLHLPVSVRAWELGLAR